MDDGQSGRGIDASSGIGEVGNKVGNIIVGGDGGLGEELRGLVGDFLDEEVAFGPGSTSKPEFEDGGSRLLEAVAGDHKELASGDFGLGHGDDFCDVRESRDFT